MSLASEERIDDAAIQLFLSDIEDALRSINAGVRGKPLGEIIGVETDLGPPHPYHLLARGLRAVVLLLDIAPIHCRVSEYLRKLLQSVPVSQNETDRHQKIMAFLRSCSGWRFLNLDCEVLTQLLRQLVIYFEEQGTQFIDNSAFAQECRAQERESEILEREPLPFRFDGINYRFGYLQSRLLRCLRDGRKHSIDEIIEGVWGEDAEKIPLRTLANRLHQLQLDTKGALKDKDLPFKIIRPVPKHMQLIKLRPT